MSPQAQPQDRHSVLIQWLDWLSKQSSPTADQQYQAFLTQHRITSEELAIARLDYLVAQMMAVSETGQRDPFFAVLERLHYTDTERKQAQQQWERVQQPQKPKAQPQRPRTKVIVPDPLAVGSAPAPDTTLGDEVHGLGARIATVATRFKKPLTYQPERSRKSIRVKRLVFEPNETTDASQLSSLKDNLVLHAGMHPDASLLIVPGAVEIHDPITGDEWEKPHFKSYVKKPSEYSFPEHGIPYTVGVDLDGKPLRRRVSAMLISGYRGSGKSQHVRSLISEVCYTHHPKHVQFALFDVCGATFTEFKGSPWLFQRPCLKPETYKELMDEVLDEARRREDLFAKHQVSTLEAWNRKYPDNPLPRIVVVVEEFGETVQRVKFGDANTVLASLARANRKQGFDLILATQVADKDDFAEDLLRNLADRVVFQAVDIGASYIGFGYNTDLAVGLQGKGDGYLKCGKTPIRFQSLYLGEDDGSRLIAMINQWGRSEYGVLEQPDEEDAWAELELATRPDEPEPRSIEQQRYELILQHEPEYSAEAISATEFCMRVFADEGISRDRMVGGTLKTRLKWIDELKAKHGG
jgi:hypothetical protein